MEVIVFVGTNATMTSGVSDIVDRWLMLVLRTDIVPSVVSKGRLLHGQRFACFHFRLFGSEPRIAKGRILSSFVLNCITFLYISLFPIHCITGYARSLCIIINFILYSEFTTIFKIRSFPNERIFFFISMEIIVSVLIHTSTYVYNDRCSSHDRKTNREIFLTLLEQLYVYYPWYGINV